MAWVGSQIHDLRGRRPLPLVLFPDGCQYRLRVLTALRRRNIPYKIVYSSSNLAGNQAAIESGLGLTAISTSTVPPTLRALSPCAELPVLDDFDFRLFWNPNGATGAMRALAAAMVRGLDDKLRRTREHTRWPAVQAPSWRYRLSSARFIPTGARTLEPRCMPPCNKGGHRSPLF